MITVSLMGSVGVPGWGAEGATAPPFFFGRATPPEPKKYIKKLCILCLKETF
jgi:hypothetical protein